MGRSTEKLILLLMVASMCGIGFMINDQIGTSWEIIDPKIEKMQITFSVFSLIPSLLLWCPYIVFKIQRRSSPFNIYGLAGLFALWGAFTGITSQGYCYLNRAWDKGKVTNNESEIIRIDLPSSSGSHKSSGPVKAYVRCKSWRNDVKEVTTREYYPTLIKMNYHNGTKLIIPTKPGYFGLEYVVHTSDFLREIKQPEPEEEKEEKTSSTGWQQKPKKQNYINKPVVPSRRTIF